MMATQSAGSKTFFSQITLPETNIAPENKPSQKEIHLPTIDFQGPCQFQGG